MVTMAPVTKKQKLVIELTASAELNLAWDGYPGHLTQVFVNLIQNVLRYAYPNQPGGKIDIRVDEFKTKDIPMFRIEFEDYGKGVTPEIKKSLFQPFVTSGREHGGTGLGLAISQNIVTNLLKGKISCTSELGKGTKFTIEIPQKVIDNSMGPLEIQHGR
jgi:signal transduction histidine kinase